MENYSVSLLENFCDFSLLHKENSVKTSKNDIDFFSSIKIKWEQRFLNTANDIGALGVSSSKCSYPE